MRCQFESETQHESVAYPIVGPRHPIESMRSQIAVFLVPCPYNLSVQDIPQDQCHCHDMASSTDYRRLALPQGGLYFTSPSRASDLEAKFKEHLGSNEAKEMAVQVMMGRQIKVKRAAG